LPGPVGKSSSFYICRQKLELLQPPACACVNRLEAAELPNGAWWGRIDDEDAIRGGKLTRALIEYQHKRNWYAGGVPQQVSAKRIPGMNSSPSHSPEQAGNFSRGQQVGFDGDIRCLGQRHLLFPVGSPQKVLEALLSARCFLGIGLSGCKCVVIRAERR
jgi:hypothetical protein